MAFGLPSRAHREAMKVERCKHGYVIKDGFACEQCKSLNEWKLHVDEDLCPHGRTLGSVCLECDQIESGYRGAVDYSEALKHMADDLNVTPDEIMDNVNSPPHYTVGGYESIDVIKAKLTPEEYRGFLKGNLMKYINRANYKGNHDTDCEKAEWYAKRLVKELKDVANVDSSS